MSKVSFIPSKIVLPPPFDEVVAAIADVHERARVQNLAFRLLTKLSDVENTPGWQRDASLAKKRADLWEALNELCYHGSEERLKTLLEDAS